MQSHLELWRFRALVGFRHGSYQNHGTSEFVAVTLGGKTSTWHMTCLCWTLAAWLASDERDMACSDNEDPGTAGSFQRPQTAKTQTQLRRAYSLNADTSPQRSNSMAFSSLVSSVTDRGLRASCVLRIVNLSSCLDIHQLGCTARLR